MGSAPFVGNVQTDGSNVLVIGIASMLVVRKATAQEPQSNQSPAFFNTESCDSWKGKWAVLVEGVVLHRDGYEAVEAPFTLTLSMQVRAVNGLYVSISPVLTHHCKRTTGFQLQCRLAHVGRRGHRLHRLLLCCLAGGQAVLRQGCVATLGAQ